MPRSELRELPTRTVDGVSYVNELDVHRAWSAGRLASPHAPRIGAAARSFDELILERLVALTLPGAELRAQVRFGRRFVDLEITYVGQQVYIEFLGPSHFIPQYPSQKPTPLSRKALVEDFFGAECVLWPFWIQRCSRNVRRLFDPSIKGLASVWSTRALFGDFVAEDSAAVIISLTERFGAIYADGIGYMYTDERVHKPVHPIVERIRAGQASVDRLLPRGSTLPTRFWLPACLHEGDSAPQRPTRPAP